MGEIEKTYYNLLNSGNLFKLYPFMTGHYDTDIIPFITIYKLLNL